MRSRGTCCYERHYFVYIERMNPAWEHVAEISVSAFRRNSRSLRSPDDLLRRSSYSVGMTESDGANQ